MKIGPLFTLNAVIAAAFGIAFIIVPAQLLQAYGVTLTPGTAVVSRLFGAALVGYGVLTWQVRASAASDALRAVVLALLVADVLGFLLSLQGVLGGATNALGWSTVVIYGLLGAGFAYFAFGKSGRA
ncbi:MAG TPA: hypothetical protein VMT11_07055 [Myxococcaceae bacterium]|nr:hypothetical protein [Myxococcaceae bacterium]